MTALSSMPMPKLARETSYRIGLAVIILSLTAFSIVNLVQGVATIASGIWLGIVALGIVGMARRRGLRRFVNEFLGMILPEFVEVLPRADGSQLVCFGCRLLHWRLLYLTVPLRRIETVKWSSGQLTSFFGRDMGDWRIIVWYDQEATKWRLKPEQDLYLAGPSGRRDRIEKFGLELVAFLRQAGASLVQAGDETTFTRSEPVENPATS